MILAINDPDKNEDENDRLVNQVLFELFACMRACLCVIGDDCVIPVFKAPFLMVSYVCQ